jgi:hypothetical protein
LAKKGLREFLSDPIVLFVTGIPLSVILNLIAAWLYDTLKRSPQPDETNLAIEYDEQGKKAWYNHSGQPISEQRFQALLDSLDQRALTYAESQARTSPDPRHPIPVNLEHTGRIVGWAEQVVKDDVGLRVDDIVIVDDDTLRRIGSGELKGLSIGGIIHRSTCSICNGEYADCNHIAGRHYGGRECAVRIDGIYVGEISVVKDPVQPLARLRVRPGRQNRA